MLLLFTTPPQWFVNTTSVKVRAYIDLTAWLNTDELK